MSVTTKAEYRHRRHDRIRRKIRGTADCPRAAIMVSSRNIYVQFIDDDAGRTLASASCSEAGKVNLSIAEALGRKAADAAKSAGIACVVFDRGGHKFHGIVKAVAEGLVREGLLAGNLSSVESDNEVKTSGSSEDVSVKGKRAKKDKKDKEEQ